MTDGRVDIGVMRACGEMFGASADRVPRCVLQHGGSPKIPWCVQVLHQSSWRDSVHSEKRLRRKSSNLRRKLDGKPRAVRCETTRARRLSLRSIFAKL